MSCFSVFDQQSGGFSPSQQSDPFTLKASQDCVLSGELPQIISFTWRTLTNITSSSIVADPTIPYPFPNCRSSKEHLRGMARGCKRTPKRAYPAQQIRCLTQIFNLGVKSTPIPSGDTYAVSSAHPYVVRQPVTWEISVSSS